jgi:hypothetical protein
MRNELINYRIQNNTSSVIPSSIWSPSSTTTNTANATTRYTFDFGTINLSVGTASFTINGVTNGVNFDGTLQGLANSLNELNYGYFLVSGNTLYTQDDTNVYGDFVVPSNYPNAYIYGDPQLVFDFSDTTSYQNSGTSIADLSGYGNNGIFTFGTGNGTPTTVTGYNTNGYLYLPGNTPTELSVRLPNSFKPTGVVPFTYIVYMNPLGYGNTAQYAGIIANGYYDGSNNFGFAWTLTPNVSPNGQYAQRNQTYVSNLAYSGGAGLGVWSVYAVKFDGTRTTTYQYYNGVLYSNVGSIDSQPIVSYPSWGMYLGNRYADWLQARFNYLAMYNTPLSDSQITTIASALSSRVII